VNKVEAAVREIREWIELYEEKNGVSVYVLRKRKALENPVSRKRK